MKPGQCPGFAFLVVKVLQAACAKRALMPSR